MAAQPQQVIEQARDLGIHHADVLGAFGHLDGHELFDRQAIGVLVGHHGDVVEPVHIGQRLNVSAALGELLGGPVQQADMRVSALDDLAVEFEHKTQHAVSSRVLRPEIECVVLDLSHVLPLNPDRRRAALHNRLRG